MSRRTRKTGEVPSVSGESGGVLEDVKPDAEMKVSFDNLRTQIEGLDSKLKIIGDKITPVDLKSIEDKMTRTLESVNEVNKSLASVEKEMKVLQTYAGYFIGLGAAGVIVFLLYVLWATHMI
jgi:hypothetical protein